MALRCSFYLFFIIFPNLILSQSSSEFKKTFYNQNLTPTDSINSVYWGFDLYHNDSLVYVFNKKKLVNKGSLLVNKNTSNLKEASPLMLNDTIVLIEKIKNQVSIIQKRIYNNGYLLFTSSERYCVIGEKKPCFIEIADFSKKYKKQEGSYLTYIIEDEKKTKKHWFYFHKNKWIFKGK